MGWKFEVNLWTSGPGDKWHYVTEYYGDSFFAAAWYVAKAKIKGCKCVKFEWR